MSAATRNSTVNTAVPRRLGARLADFFTLCKPRVNSLIVFTAMIGMFLASPGVPPLGLFLLAVLVGLGASIFVLWAMLTNRFFAATVRIQEDRGHHVIDSGPYRIVRHPGYLGAIVFQIGVPLLLGSWPSLVPSAVSAVLYAVRTALEDRFLQLLQEPDQATALETWPSGEAPE